jgi:hypothetical protein
LGVAEIALPQGRVLGVTLSPVVVTLASFERRAHAGDTVRIAGTTLRPTEDLRVVVDADTESTTATIDIDVDNGAFAVELPLPRTAGIARASFVSTNDKGVDETVGTLAFYVDVEPPNQVDSSLLTADNRPLTPDVIGAAINAWRVEHKRPEAPVHPVLTSMAEVEIGDMGGALKTSGLLNRGIASQRVSHVSSIRALMWMLENVPDIRERVLLHDANHHGVHVGEASEMGRSVSIVIGMLVSVVNGETEAAAAHRSIARLRVQKKLAPLHRDVGVETVVASVAADVCSGKLKRTDSDAILARFNSVLNVRRYKAVETVVLTGIFPPSGWRQFDSFKKADMSELALAVCSGAGAAEGGETNAMFGLALIGRR